MPNDFAVVSNAPASASLDSDTPTVIAGLSIGDEDSALYPGDSYTVTLEATHGAIHLGSTAGLSSYSNGILGTGTVGPTPSLVFSSDEGSIAFTGTLDAINSALATATHTPDSGYTGSATLRIQVIDGVQGGTRNTDSDTVTLSIAAPGNDAPVIADLDGDTADFVEEMGRVYLDVGTAALVTDDNANFAGGQLTVAIVANKNSSQDVIVFDPDNSDIQIGENDDGTALTLIVDGVVIGEMPQEYGAQGDNITVTLNADATAAAVTKLIGALTYNNLSTTTPSTATRTVEISLTDGNGPDALTETVQAFVTVTDAPEVNHAPILDLSGAAVVGNDVTRAYTENAAAVRLAPAGTSTDQDSTPYNGGSLVVSITGALATDQLTMVNQGSVIILDGSAVMVSGSVVATFSGGANGTPLTVLFLPDLSSSQTPAYTVTDILRSVAYSSTSNAPPAQRTITFTLNDGGGTDNGGSDTSIATATVNITALDDASTLTLADDTVTGTEDADLVFSSANGNAISVADPDLETLTVTLSVANGTLTLSQTTNLSVAGDGTATVELTGSATDINAALNGLAYRGNLHFEGADSLDIEVDDGSAPPVTDSIAIALADDGQNDVTIGIDTLLGTAAMDIFDLSLGGDDKADGLGGNDGFFMGDELSALDDLDGGAGSNDQLILQGNVTATILANHMQNIEVISLLSGATTQFGDTANNFYDYVITMDDSAVDAGERLKIWASGLRAGEDLTFDGSAETDGHFTIYAGEGTDFLTGGHGDDYFFFGDGRFGAGDRVVGNGGAQDQLGLRGNYTVTFASDTISGIDTIVLISGSDSYYGPSSGPYSYSVTTHDDNVAAGETLAVWGLKLASNETMSFNGGAETDGRFDLYGGAGNDVLTGGAGNDMIYGALRGDTLTGGAGNDTFVYRSVADSNSTERDGIQDFNAGDLIDLSFIDADTVTAGNQAFDFVGTAAFTNTAGELRYENISLGGPIWLVQGDTNGDGVSDFEVVLVISPADPITAGDFVL
jgi:Ca2+-binding RTX toxin-like protein